MMQAVVWHSFVIQIANCKQSAKSIDYVGQHLLRYNAKSHLISVQFTNRLCNRLGVIFEIGHSPRYKLYDVIQ